MFDPECSYPYIIVGRQSGITTNRKFVQHLTIYRFRTDKSLYLVEVEYIHTKFTLLNFIAAGIKKTKSVITS
jgi:hypothetical protein